MSGSLTFYGEVASFTARVTQDTIQNIDDAIFKRKMHFKQIREDEAQRQQQELEKQRKLREDTERRRQKEREEQQRKSEEERKRKEMEEETLRKQREEEEKRRREEEEFRRKKEEEASRPKGLSEDDKQKLVDLFVELMNQIILANVANIGKTRESAVTFIKENFLDNRIAMKFIDKWMKRSSISSTDVTRILGDIAGILKNAGGVSASIDPTEFRSAFAGILGYSDVASSVLSQSLRADTLSILVFLTRLIVLKKKDIPVGVFGIKTGDAGPDVNGLITLKLNIENDKRLPGYFKGYAMSISELLRPQYYD